MYASNGGFSSNACRKLMTSTIKNPQHGIRVQLVLKLTNDYKWRKLKLTAALTSRSERVNLNYDARIGLKTKIFEQTFHHHLDNLLSFPLIYRLWVSDAYLRSYIRKTEDTAQGER